MRHLAFVLLAACWTSSTTPPPESPRETEAAASSSAWHDTPTKDKDEPVTIVTCQRKTKWVVFDFDADPANAAIARDLSNALRSAASTDPCVQIVRPNVSLADAKLASQCASESAACMSGIAQQWSADFMIYGRVDATKVLARRLSVTTKQANQLVMTAVHKANITDDGRVLFAKLR